MLSQKSSVSGGAGGLGVSVGCRAGGNRGRQTGGRRGCIFRLADEGKEKVK